MIGGYSGRLVASQFLEEVIGASPADVRAGSERCRRRLKRWRTRNRTLGPASSLTAMLETGAGPLVESLGFDPPRSRAESKNSLTAGLSTPGAVVSLVVTPWGDDLDAFWRTAVTDAVARGSNWSLLFNGCALRLLNPRRLYSRRYAQFDLELALDDPASFLALWTLARSPALGPRREVEDLIDASDRAAAGVSRSLRGGVLDASRGILAALFARAAGKGRRASLPEDAFEQALTIVYRLLFLLFAEARGLVPAWHRVYRDSYTIEALAAAAARGEPALGAWDSLRAITRLAHAGCRAGDLRVTPFNGRLFAPARTPLAEQRDLDDEAARRAVLALCTRASADRAHRDRIAYRDLGVEQLGAVYETLLDYSPTLRRERGRLSIDLAGGAGVRKETGTFYTPQPLADSLVRRTLGPIVRDAPADRILALRILDPAMGSGAFLIAACRFLAGAYEAARVREGGCHPSDFDEAERARIRREIAERCLYGVDLNPMAVQLARLSLWLATLAAGRPLTFLDHHLVSGDSLLGAWLSHLKRPPSPRHRAAPGGLPLFDDRGLPTVIHGVLPGRFRLEGPDETVEEVRDKERVHAALIRRDSALSKWKRVADVWCATWFAAAGDGPHAPAFAALTDRILTGKSELPEQLSDRWLQHAAAIARRRRFFHWELEFPEVFFDGDGTRRADGGFDAILGNPPWDMIRADSVAAADRPRARQDAAALVRFTRDADIYSAQSAGHANRYQLFLERAIDLTRPGGRIGLVLPAGVLADRGSAGLRRHFFSRCDVDAIVGFDNRLGAFPIHRSVRFVLGTATAGSPTRSMACRFGESDVSALDAADADDRGWHPLTVTTAMLDRISGDDWSIPWLNSPIDLRIAERAASLYPPLSAPEGWHVHFSRELNATDDRDALLAPGRGLPVIEGKQLEPFRVNAGASRASVSLAEAGRRLPDRRFLAARLGYRDVAGATNRLTLIAAILPARTVSTHTVFCLRTPLPQRDQHLLCGFFNSFVLNYLVRLRVSTHVTTHIVGRLPVPTPDRAPRACREIAAIARLLAGRDEPAARARLHALAARLYQLTRDEFAHVLETFPLVDRGEREAALNAFEAEARRL